ncbi:MAG: type II toxin-antitoxin system HicB family antitoxin [Nitrospirae bacterium]|nr:type II toxin-antitoxin system HicB family antitoxin [Nitrospirota bacterium]MBF0592688.1 type II toxin-antitoxin system HicB family antitoxin [Nitrospirota bacterium]
MMAEYIHEAIKKATYKVLDNGMLFAEIPDFAGVWATGTSVEECRDELIEVLGEWLILKIRENDPLPVVNNIDLCIREVTTIV